MIRRRGGNGTRRVFKENTQSALKQTNIPLISGPRVSYFSLKNGRQPSGENTLSTSVQTTGKSSQNTKKGNTVVHNARAVMFIIFPSNLYFPCGVINQILLQIKVFTKKSTVESLKNHLLET